MDERTRHDATCIDVLTHRRRPIDSLEAAECADMLEYIDRARVAGEAFASRGADGERARRLHVDAGYHELSLARKLPVKTEQDTVCRTRRVRSTLPSVWAAWNDGLLSTRDIVAIDASATRLTHPESLVALDVAAVGAAAERTPGQLSSWRNRWCVPDDNSPRPEPGAVGCEPWPGGKHTQPQPALTPRAAPEMPPVET